MKDGSNLNDFLASLYQRHARGIKLGLETTQSILDAIGNPERELACIHVAGTNGKGSVCAMLDSVLCAAEIRSGLFTSPHLIAFNERIRVNGVAISDSALYDLLKDVDAAANAVAAQPGNRQPTFFEFSTVAALTHFHREGVQAAVLETGLGGRLDSTNVVDPVLAAITSIGIDHVSFLGETLEGIAREKAGIIKPGRTVVLGAMGDAARAELLRLAAERRAPVIRADEAVSIRRIRQDHDGQTLSIETGEGAYPRVTLPLLGRHQVSNAAIAIAAAEHLGSLPGWAITDAPIRSGLESVSWPARGQVLATDPLVILDAAHNPSGAKALRAMIDDVEKDRPLGLIAGFADDKPPEGFLRCFTGRSRECWIVPLDSPRGRDPQAVIPLARGVGMKARACPLDTAIDEARRWAADNNGVICIAGSIYLAGEVLRRRQELGLG